ncbi:probable serine/threonine-protein kinase At1g54610 [Nymphaea colorata]|nr:probable serine/threonine-protein kinase At1g54610 [Nymphaea colorata]
MGCICSKSARKDAKEGSVRRGKGSIKISASSRRLRVVPSRKDEVVVEPEAATDKDARARQVLKPSENVVVLPASSAGEKKADKVDKQTEGSVKKPQRTQPRDDTSDIAAKENHGLWAGNVPNQLEGEQIAAGWPSWLTSVAGEAIKGWIPRRADSFEKLDKIGQGTYSNVYKARDLETGKIVALKKVRFVNMDPESVRFMAREINILRRLDHPNVVKLEGLVTSRMSCGLYLVFEYMEHDLAGLSCTAGVKFTEPQIKCYMKQLLLGLEHCHSRGVLHRDIKGSNLLIDNNGILQIADFGLATFFNPDQKQPLTSRVVTLWYRPPELLLGATEYGVAVDLWSAGCILAELFAGKPIMPGRTEVEQLHKIFKLCGSPTEDYWKKSKLQNATLFKPHHPYKRCFRETFKDFPVTALSLLDSLLAIEPEHRRTATAALKSEFFTTRPLACDPSSLPKYPPSKELDVKLRDEEARRQKSSDENAHQPDNKTRGAREPGAKPAPDATAQFRASMQRKQGHSNPKSNREKYHHKIDDTLFPNEPPRAASLGTSKNVLYHSGPLLHPNQGWNKKQKDGENQTIHGRTDGGSGKGAKPSAELRSQRSYMPHMASELSSDLPARSNSKQEHSREKGTRILNKYSPIEVSEQSERQQRAHHLIDRPATTTHKKDERTTGSTTAYGHKKSRIHYSGPLLPPSANIDEMLKEHERQIQQAVRKARLDKTKTKKNQELGRYQF